MSRPRSPLRLALIGSIVLTVSGCSPTSNDSKSRVDVSTADAPITGSATNEPASPPAAAVSTGSITRENILANERYWPDIVAMVEPSTLPDSARLKKGYRGALIRVDELGRSRIAFGRHGTHDVPLELTDLISRANEVQAGSRHKVAPNFLAHFGTQFVHPVTPELIPFPMVELAAFDRFLCIFADPRGDGFEALARRLAPLEGAPGMQMLFFPLAMKRDETQTIKDLLEAASLQVPFAYPEAAEVHARTLLGEVPTGPFALLVTAEGRLLHSAGIDDAGELEALRSAIESSVPIPAQ